MKKSRSVTLTVVTAFSMAARAQQVPAGPAAPPVPQSCEDRRNAAKAAGTKFTENCGHSSGAHGTSKGAVSRGGFGATGEGHSGGG
jgi:hypothetical protein